MELRWSRLKPILIALENVLAAGLGCLFVYTYNHQPSGYVAPYMSLELLVFSVLAGSVGVLLLIPRRTRIAGMSTLAAIALFGGISVGGARLSYWLGYTKWKNAAMVRIGPDVTESMVVYFRRGISEQELQNFVATALQYPGIKGGGRASDDVICMYLRLLPLEQHKAVAVTFCPKLDTATRDRIRAAVRESPLVYKVFENVSPIAVKHLD